MKQIALSIEQMKHLEELGLDTSDASMFYIWDDYRNNYAPCPVLVWNSDEQKEWLTTTIGKKSLFTYTLQDILEKLPKMIDDIYFLKMFINCHGKITLKYDKHPQGDKCCFGEDDCKTLLNASYKLLCWCIENSHIKTK